MKSLTTAAAALTIAISLPFTGFAGPHPLQQQLQRQLDAAKAKQEAAEGAKASERRRLIGEHMQMMQQAIRQMQAAKPQAGTSIEEHQDWIDAHQKLMGQALQQMIKDYELLLQEWSR